MRNLQFRETALISYLEGKARRVTFHPRLTLVKGENRTGKSSLLKSLYHTFGAEPAISHKRWRHAGVCTLLKFSVDDINYAVLRDGSDIAVFDGSDRLVERLDANRPDLSEFWAQKFHFDLKLVSPTGDIITPGPEYIFAPFYLDQDTSWKKNWSGFRRHAQISHWRQDVAEYHLGMRPGRFYELKARSIRLHEAIRLIQSQKKLLRETHRSISEHYDDVQFDVDFESYESEIQELLVQCTKLRSRDEEFKQRLSDLQSRKMVLDGQAAIVRKVKDEVASDYAFATSNITDDHVECPTCGAQYENTIVERFHLALDGDRCDEILLGLQRGTRAVDRLLQREREKYQRNANDLQKVTELLEAKRGEVKLQDLIRREGKRELQKVLFGNIQETVTREADIAHQIKECERLMSGHEEREHRTQIAKEFASSFKRFSRELGIQSDLSNNITTNVALSIAETETGSTVPRALLAYYFALLGTIARHSTSTLCPIVIDSPNQQDQTIDNVRRILEFIRTHQPAGTQMILAIAESHGANFAAETIELSREGSLLEQEQYEFVANHIRPYRGQLTALAVKAR